MIYVSELYIYSSKRFQNPIHLNYRRKEGRLEWHFHQDCRKYPVVDFVEANSNEDVQSTMVCPICKRIRDEENGSVDTRQVNAEPQGFFGFVRSALVGRS